MVPVRRHRIQMVRRGQQLVSLLLVLAVGAWGQITDETIGLPPPVEVLDFDSQGQLEEVRSPLIR
jgi:hypothetical protein